MQAFERQKLLLKGFIEKKLLRKKWNNRVLFLTNIKNSLPSFPNPRSMNSPEKRKWDHAIELKDDFKEKFTKVYPLNPHEQKQLDEFIEENLATGRIRPSKSPMASPVFFIKKKDGSLRLIQDYRALNEMTIKNRYPLPLISELLDKLKKARYFTALDVRWGYNNI